MKEIKYCPYCRADIAAGQKSCAACGRQIPKAKKSNILTAIVIVVAVAAAYGLMYTFRDKSVAAASVVAKETPDLSMLYLKGPVKSVLVQRKVKDSDEWMDVATYKFDEQGRLTSYPWWPEYFKISYDDYEDGMITAEDGNPVMRDLQGRITSLSAGESEYTNFINWDYENDEVSEAVDGYYTTTRVVAKTNGGLPMTVEVESSGRGMTDYYTRKYTYTDFDDYGNYIEASYSEESKTDYGNEEWEPALSSTEMEERRVITYYE